MNETLVDGGDREQQDDEHQSDGEAGTELPFTRTITPENRAVISAAQRKELQNKRLGYNASAPVCPEYILNRILDYLESEPIVIKQKHRFVTSVCRYWALKLASRRGAPLLKRLHLEVNVCACARVCAQLISCILAHQPWTAFSSTIRANEALMLRRFKTLHHLREDLEKARMLAELVRKREKEKLRMLKLQMEYILMRLRPLDVILRRTIESIRA